MAEDHVGREDEWSSAQRVVLKSLLASVVDVAVRADLGRRDGTEVRGAAVQRREVALLVTLVLLLLRLGLPLVAPDLRARPALHRCVNHTARSQRHCKLLGSYNQSINQSIN